MASIRRTLSPAYHDRNNSRHPNGAVHYPLFLSSSPPHKLFSATVKSNGFYAKREAFLGMRSLYRCLLFFVLGIVLGVFPFGHVVDRARVNDAQSGDDASLVLLGSPDVSSLEINPPPVEAMHDGFSLSAVSLGSVEDKLSDGAWNHEPPRGRQLIVVTPTYPRAAQAYFLSRLGQLLKLVAPPVVWIVVEGGEGARAETAEVLRRTGVMYRHLVTGKKAAEEANNDRGVHQRNAALEHIERHRLDGIVYFADDDNVYTLELFQRLRDINRFGTWPVAMLVQSKNKAILEGPVCNGSQVIGWHTNEKSKQLRRFHVDMSGFAFNSTILWDPKRWGRPFPNPIRQLDKLKEGFQETTFIEQVVEDESQMEGVPPGCTKILNWHLHLDAHGLVYPRGWLLQKNLDVVIPIK